MTSDMIKFPKSWVKVRVGSAFNRQNPLFKQSLVCPTNESVYGDFVELMISHIKEKRLTYVSISPISDSAQNPHSAFPRMDTSDQTS